MGLCFNCPHHQNKQNNKVNKNSNAVCVISSKLLILETKKENNNCKDGSVASKGVAIVCL